MDTCWLLLRAVAYYRTPAISIRFVRLAPRSGGYPAPPSTPPGPSIHSRSSTNTGGSVATRFKFLAACLLALALAVGTLPVTAQAATSDVDRIVSDTNAARAKQGLPALKRNTKMDAVSLAWAKKMAAANSMYHNPNYSTQIPGGWSSARENIARGYRSTTVVNAWLNSPGHRTNIMAASTDIGVGYYVDGRGQAWSVQNFAAYPTPSFTRSPTPVVTGTAKVGQTLKAAAGPWTPVPTLTYQWKRGSTTIANATASAYKLVNADIGTKIAVTITAKKSGVTTATRTSAATAAVTSTLSLTPVPKISGTARAGQTLTATAGTWAPAPVAVSYQWTRSGSAIKGATAKTFVVRPTDVDATISVRATGTRSFYASVARSSVATTKVTGLKYTTCAGLNKIYPHGVAKIGTKYDRVSGANKALKGPPFFSSTLYALNTTRDADKDAIACEK